ncbi:MAG: hypothetical protein QOF43_1187 [Gaiellaceae bacterium]|nr:hypothetical protein [Gaiellaceae bacterium]
MSGRAAAAAVFVLASLAAAPAAAGDGPMPGAQQLGSGVLSSDGTARYVAVGVGSDTSLLRIEAKTGFVQQSSDLVGMWGVPVATYSNQAGEGLTVDGRSLVLADIQTSYPRTSSAFSILDTRFMRARLTFSLKGDFAYDAISPNGKRLYLIQHVDPSDTQHYVVREYDVAAGRLLPGRIADRTQKGWVMQGYPLARTMSGDGRWVYTLYQNPGGFPFVHALDTVRGVAHCVGLPWAGSQDGMGNMRLSLRNHERTLAVHWLSGRPWRVVDTATWRTSLDHRTGVPWFGLGAGGAGALAAAAAWLLARRRRRHRLELEHELSELLRSPERVPVS